MKTVDIVALRSSPEVVSALSELLVRLRGAVALELGDQGLPELTSAARPRHPSSLP